MRPRIYASVISALLSIALHPGHGMAQIPDEFQNLQVFPEGIERRQLLLNMRDFSFALGVRCEYCHVGQGNDLSRFDFISDTRETKKIAREMLRMVARINESTLPRLQQFGKDPEKLVTVRCITCHRGQPRPLMIEEVLQEVLDSEGVEAAVDRYRTLRERYYGDFTYDFSETAIREFGYSLFQQERPGEALAFLRLTLTYFTGSTTTWNYIGQIQVSLGDRDEAIAAYRKVLELDPGNQVATLRLKELGVPPSRG